VGAAEVGLHHGGDDLVGGVRVVVVVKSLMTLNALLRTLTSAVRQLAVQDAFQMHRAVGVTSSLLTPRTRAHLISSADGTDRTTFVAPAMMRSSVP
jgi:hypothetical protein